MKYNTIYVIYANFMKNVAVIGGGVLGMCLAHYLSKEGFKVTLSESQNELGGLASGFTINGSPLEKYYHHFFKSDTESAALMTELGLGSELEWLKSKVGVFTGKGIYDFSTSISLLKFPEISLINRIRGGLVSLYLQKSKDVKKFEKVSALTWCYKYFGKQFTNVIWRPLLLAKFGKKYYDKISMAWLWTRVHDRSSSRRGIFDYEYLGYPKNSFASIIQKLHEALLKDGVNIKLKTDIISHKLDKENNKHIIQFSDNMSPEVFDTVIVTTPPNVLISKFEVNQEYLKSLKNINFLGAVCYVFKLNKSFSPHYWLNITDPEFPFLAVVEHTNFVDADLFKGDKVLYIAKYLQTDDKLFKMSENQLFDIYVEYLKKINPNFDKTWVVDKYYFKTSYAQHVVPVGFKPIPYETGTKGLYYVNFSQIYPHDRGMNYAVLQAKEIAKLLKTK